MTVCIYLNFFCLTSCTIPWFQGHSLDVVIWVALNYSKSLLYDIFKVQILRKVTSISSTDSSFGFVATGVGEEGVLLDSLETTTLSQWSNSSKHNYCIVIITYQLEHYMPAFTGFLRYMYYSGRCFNRNSWFTEKTIMNKLESDFKIKNIQITSTCIKFSGYDIYSSR